MLFKIVIGLITLGAVVIVADGKKALTCYVMFWSVYRDAEGRFSMDLIEPSMCTHIIYSYNGIKRGTQQITPLDPSADLTPGLGNIERLVRLKDENPGLKILVSLGGWSEGSRLFSAMVQSNENRTTFIRNAMDFIRSNELDGLDFDWQYPTRNGGKDQDKDNFASLLEELRKAFDTAGYILTVRIVAMRYITDPGYDLVRTSRAVHYINLRTFGYHGDWEPKTGLHAPLTSNDQLNVEYSLDYIIRSGVEPKKLLLGIRSGGSAVLMNETASAFRRQIFLGVPTTGPVTGTLTQQPGFFGYNDFCWERSWNQPWRVYWHNSSSTPYAVMGKKFISFDNKESIKLKLKLVDLKELGGVNIYSVDSDDFRGFCDNVTFPITKQVRDALFGAPRPPAFTTSVISSSYP